MVHCFFNVLVFRDFACSKAWGFCAFCSGISSALLDLYSVESSSLSWAGGGPVPGGGAVFLGRAAGLGLDEVPKGEAGALVRCSCLSLASEMVAIYSEQL